MEFSLAQQVLVVISHMLGIDVSIKCIKSGLCKHIHYSEFNRIFSSNYVYFSGQILGKTIYLDIDFFSLKTHDAHEFALEHTDFDKRYKIPFSWSNMSQECSYESMLMLECFLASRSFEIDCKENERRVCIGNPFYRQHGLMDCESEEEFNVKIDLLGIDDMHDKNIADVKKILAV
jgi:hypothetical protein